MALRSQISWESSRGKTGWGFADGLTQVHGENRLFHRLDVLVEELGVAAGFDQIDAIVLDEDGRPVAMQTSAHLGLVADLYARFAGGRLDLADVGGVVALAEAPVDDAGPEREITGGVVVHRADGDDDAIGVGGSVIVVVVIDGDEAVRVAEVRGGRTAAGECGEDEADEGEVLHGFLRVLSRG